MTDALTSATTIVSASTTFAHDCAVRRTHIRANQHGRTEHGKCTVCGKPHHRRFRNRSDDSREWWVPS